MVEYSVAVILNNDPIINGLNILHDEMFSRCIAGINTLAVEN